MAVRPQVMPDLLPQQSSGGSPVTGMTRLNSTEDAKQKPFMSFGFSAEAGGAKPVIGASGAGDPSRRESTHVPSVNVAPTPAVHDMTSDTPEIRKYKKRFNSEILCAALWGVNLLIGNYYYFLEDIKFFELHACDILQFCNKYGRKPVSTLNLVPRKVTDS